MKKMKSASLIFSAFILILLIGFIIIDTEEVSDNISEAISCFIPNEVAAVAATTDNVEIKKYKANEKVSIGNGIYYKVLDIEPDYKTYVKPKEDYNFIGIRVKFVNNTKSTVSVTSFVCKNDMNKNCEIKYLDDNIINRLAPESELETTFYFEVPNNSNGLDLYYNDSSKVEIDLPNF